MPLTIKALSAPSRKGWLNEEWMLVHNAGERPFNTEGCSISVGRGSSRPKLVTTLKAGLVIQPKETCRLVTGSSGKKSHGAAPEDEDVRNVHLFLKASYLDKPGVVVRLMNRQLELCRATYDTGSESGVASAEE